MALRRIADIANKAARRAAAPVLPLPRPRQHVVLSDAELSDLAAAVAAVTPDDLAIHRPDFTRAAPLDGDHISYVSVATRPNVLMAVFVMPPGAEIPLHDHKHMFVVSSVLWGTLEVQEYDVLTSTWPALTRQRVAVKRELSVLRAGGVRSLTPSRGNVHSFRAREWTAVFDVLVPPYDPHQGRECHYFLPFDLDTTPNPRSGEANQQQVLLKQVPCPPTYHTVSVAYRGKPLTD